MAGKSYEFILSFFAPLQEIGKTALVLFDFDLRRRIVNPFLLASNSNIPKDEETVGEYDVIPKIRPVSPLLYVSKIPFASGIRQKEGQSKQQGTLVTSPLLAVQSSEALTRRAPLKIAKRRWK